MPYKKKTDFTKKVKSIVKDQLKKENEVQHKYIADQQAMTSQVMYSINLTNNITQGTGESNRKGDKIKIKDFKIKLRSQLYSEDCTFRVVLYKNDSDTITGSDVISSSVGGSNFFKTFTFPFQDVVDSKNSYGNVVLYDKTFVYRTLVGQVWITNINKTINRAIEFARGANYSAKGGSYYLSMVAQKADDDSVGNVLLVDLQADISFIDPN